MKTEIIITAVTAFALGWIVCSIVHEATRMRLATESSIRTEEAHRFDALVCWHRRAAGTGPLCMEI